MIFLFDYIFYRVTYFYLQISNDKSNNIMGSVILTILQLFNIASVALILSIHIKSLASFFDSSNQEQGKTFFMMLCTVLLVLNIYKYSKVTPYSVLKQKWGLEKVREKRIRKAAISFYTILSIVFLIVSIKIYK